jgi:hypothetical protein
MNSEQEKFRLCDGTELTKEQLLMALNLPEAKEIFKKDREDRINSWCRTAYEMLGAKGTLALLKPLLALAENIKWDVLIDEDRSICKDAMGRLLVIFDSEEQPLLSDDDYYAINQELHNELGRN